MFIPRRILFEKGSLDYEIGKNIYEKFKDNPKVEMIELSSNKIKQNIPGDNLYDFYREGKKTLVVGIKKGFKFQSCKPSAHYQLPLISGCVGQCEYCYLNTNLGDRPYLKINVNIDDILNKAEKYMKERFPSITIFEGSATSDPVPVEPYTHSLRKTIEFFGKTEKGRFRFVTKYSDVDTLLNVEHNGNTEIRFTINTAKVINDYENKTASIDMRIGASANVAKAGYPTGFIIAPVFLYENWKEEYKNLLLQLNSRLPKNLNYPVTFEVISHRYTTRAKNIIQKVFPETTLPMKDEERTYKYGQFGYGKFLYTKEQLQDMKEFFTKEINSIFDNKEIKYII
ncbi:MULTISPECIES: spore photoproduct lyase [Clostridium]|uniref:Spore photoproduct lyase n=2 Tax=Clostridium TaxID=1485 RepID=A0A151AKZ6_9CLOT|nr:MULTISPECIES: spore photoproduct lyase [Clostridium]KYH28288.1 spore photoproduct lyase [Clostridium colicanis DSM 13634]PRR74294.1 Spore photoproduct lyase [Clostridium thermopalmarium DSM 5974]PVZ22082.1 spore photoproduct lyase [Clostridium thermopalmarium DSM 5974]